MRKSNAFAWGNVRPAIATAAVATALTLAPPARAQCAFNPPTNDVPADAEPGIPLLYTGKLNVFNVYWSSNWDANPANFPRADIENAMKAVIDSMYFDRLCQYGVPGFQWEGKADTSGFFNPCAHDPGPVTSTLGMLEFMSCSEYSLGTGVPLSGGLPNPLTCPVCGAVPIDCFDPIANAVVLGGNPIAGAAAAATCIATPNPTANRVYVLFLPKGTIIDDFGRQSCPSGAYNGFHMQIPSRAIFAPVPPFTIPGTQGRPINVVIIPTECFTSVGDMMSAVTHEIVEAATDPLPLAHWIDESVEPRPTSSRLDPSNLTPLLTAGEIADECGGSQTLVAPDGTPIKVAEYWSNHDNMCVSLDVTPPMTTASAAPPAHAGWNTTDVDVTLTAQDEPGGSGVKQIAFDATGAGALAPTTVAGASAIVTISAQGSTVLRFAAEDNAGNKEGRQSILVRIDRTAPTIAASAAPPANPAGWNNTAVQVTFTCADSLSGIAQCPAPIVLSADGANQSASGTALDVAGNSAQATAAGISVDRTAPTVSYAGNAGSYTVDQSIDIVCTAADNLSGVASTTCSDVHQAAYLFPLGATTLSATATDRAGNTAGASASFTVIVTAASLCSLSSRFCSDPDIAHALCVKLQDLGSAPAEAGHLTAFVNQVAAQTGKTISPGDAAILVALANSL